MPKRAIGSRVLKMRNMRKPNPQLLYGQLGEELGRPESKARVVAAESALRGFEDLIQAELTHWASGWWFVIFDSG